MSSGESSAAMLDLALVQSLALSMHNAVIRQQNGALTAQAATTAASARILQAQGGAATGADAPLSSAEGAAAAEATCASEASESAGAGDARAVRASASRVEASAAGKAYQAVAQSAALAAQDATDQLRNISTLSTTAMGVAIAQFLATGDAAQYAAAMGALREMMDTAVANFAAIQQAAAQVLGSFPSPSSEPASAERAMAKAPEQADGPIATGG